MLVEIIVGKNTGDVALATALDYVRVIGKTPIVVNDSRGFFANRCVLRFTAEGLDMLMEGVPPAMIENTAKMAGMPVGPLSLSDEIALDLVLKIMKATEADLGSQAVDQAQKKLIVEMVEKQERLGRKNGKGFYDYPPKGKGSKHLWPGLAELVPAPVDPETLDIEELKQRFLVVQAVEAARTVEDHVITDVREADVGSILGFGFAPFTGGTLSYIDFMGTKVRRAVPQARSEIRLALHAAETARRHGEKGRDVLRPLPAEEVGGGRCVVALTRGAELPTEEEVADNRRAAPARLRGAERVREEIGCETAAGACRADRRAPSRHRRRPRAWREAPRAGGGGILGTGEAPMKRKTELRGRAARLARLLPAGAQPGRARPLRPPDRAAPGRRAHHAAAAELGAQRGLVPAQQAEEETNDLTDEQQALQRDVDGYSGSRGPAAPGPRAGHGPRRRPGLPRPRRHGAGLPGAEPRPARRVLPRRARRSSASPPATVRSRPHPRRAAAPGPVPGPARPPPAPAARPRPPAPRPTPPPAPAPAPPPATTTTSGR